MLVGKFEFSLQTNSKEIPQNNATGTLFASATGVNVTELIMNRLQN